MRDLFDILDAIREDIGDSDAVLVRREDILMLLDEVHKLTANAPSANAGLAGNPTAIGGYGARFVVGAATYPQAGPVVVH